MALSIRADLASDPETTPALAFDAYEHDGSGLSTSQIAYSAPRLKKVDRQPGVPVDGLMNRLWTCRAERYET